MFLSEKFRMFRTQAQKENCLVSKRSEFRLKSFVSSLDVRAWSFDCEDRRKAFLESVNNPGIHVGNYVPFIELMQILGIKKAFLLRETNICKKQHFEDVQDNEDDTLPISARYSVTQTVPGPGDTNKPESAPTSEHVPCDDALRKELDTICYQQVNEDVEIKYDNTIKFHSHDQVSSLMYQDQEVLIENIKYSQGKMSQTPKMRVSSKHTNTEMGTTTLIVPNNSASSTMVGQEIGFEDQKIKVHAIIESYHKMKLHLEKLIPVVIEKDNLESEIVNMSETIKDLTKVISYQDNEINRLINILQCDQETMVQQDRCKSKSDFCQMVPSTNDSDQMCLHMISVNSQDKNQQLYFYQLQISLKQERKNFNKLLKLLRIEQETRKNIQQELNKQLRKATELAVERDLLRKTLQYNEKTVQRYMLESETEKEKAKLLEHSLTVLEQQLERIERSLRTDIENCKTLQSQQIVDRIQKYIKDSKKLNEKLLCRNRLETSHIPSRSDTELYKQYSSVSKILFSKGGIMQTPCYDGDGAEEEEEDQEIKFCLDRMYKNRCTPYSRKIRTRKIKSTDSLPRYGMKQTSVIFEKSEPESDGKLCNTTSSKIKIRNEMCSTVTSDIEELYKRLKSKPQQLEAQEFNAEKVISKVSLGKIRAKDELCDSEITLLGLKNTKSSMRTRKNSSILKQKDSDLRVPSKHKSDAKKKPYLSEFHPKSLQLPSDRNKAETRLSERRGKALKRDVSKSSRTKVGRTGLIDKFYPDQKKSTSSRDGLKTPKKSTSVILQRSVSSCTLDMHTRLARTRARLQEIYDKYSDGKNEFTKQSKTFIPDKCSLAYRLPIQESLHVCTSAENYADLSRNYKTTFSSSQKQFAPPGTVQSSHHQTCVTEGTRPCGGGAQTKYLAIYTDDSTGKPTTSKLIDNKLYPQKTAAEKHFICSSIHSLKTVKCKDDSFYHNVNTDINCRYIDPSTSKDKYRPARTYKQESPVYSNKDVYKKYTTDGSNCYQTASRDRMFTPKENYLLEKPSYRHISKYEGYYKTEPLVTDFKIKDKTPLKYPDVVDENIIGARARDTKIRPKLSTSKKAKKKIQFENNRAKPYGYELPDSNKYTRHDREDYYFLPEKDNMHAFTMDGGKNFCTVCDSNFERKYNTTNELSPSYKASDEENVNCTIKDWKQTTTLGKKDSNYYKDMFTRDRETSYQLLDRIHKQDSSRYQTNKDRVYRRQDMPEFYKVKTVIKQQEPLKPTTVRESYYKRPLDPYSQPGTTSIRSQVSTYSTRKPPSLTPSEYIEYLKVKHARRANTFT